MKKEIYRKYIKRPIDIMLPLCAIIVLSPMMLAVAFLIRSKLGRPVIFKQKRPGLNGKIFTLYKFRTMTDKKDDNGSLQPDRMRLTRFGKILRSASLDELPELFNVLRGDMSLVGPRPLLIEYLPRYTFEQARRHEVKPGITGWVQVNGRNALSWEEKFKFDVWYVDHQNIWLDVKILTMTVWAVLIRRGVSANGHATMPEFRVNDVKKS